MVLFGPRRPGADAGALRGAAAARRGRRGDTQPESALSCSHFRPPAIHGRLWASPLRPRRAPPFPRSGKTLDPDCAIPSRSGLATRCRAAADVGVARAACCGAGAGAGAAVVAFAVSVAVAVAVALDLPEAGHRHSPSRAQGVCGQPAMDGRRPAVGAGRGDAGGAHPLCARRAAYTTTEPTCITTQPRKHLWPWQTPIQHHHSQLDRKALPLTWEKNLFIAVPAPEFARHASLANENSSASGCRRRSTSARSRPAPSML